MNSNQTNREYLTFDVSKGYPAADDLYYECLTCVDIVPSKPSDDIACKCKNVIIDVGYGRMDIGDVGKTRLFRLIKPR